MREILFFFTILFIIAGVNAQGLYYAFELYYDNGTVEIRDSKVIFSNDNLENVVNEKYFKTYSLDLIDENGKREKVYFGILNKGFYDEWSPETEELVSGGLREFTNVSFVVYAPYTENAREMIIYDTTNKEVARDDLKEFSRTDSLSNQGENKETTTSPEKYLKYFPSNNYTMYVILIGILLVLIIIYFISRKPKNKKR